MGTPRCHPKMTLPYRSPPPGLQWGRISGAPHPTVVTPGADLQPSSCWALGRIRPDAVPMNPPTPPPPIANRNANPTPPPLIHAVTPSGRCRPLRCHRTPWNSSPPPVQSVTPPGGDSGTLGCPSLCSICRRHLLGSVGPEAPLPHISYPIPPYPPSVPLPIPSSPSLPPFPHPLFPIPYSLPFVPSLCPLPFPPSPVSIPFPPSRSLLSPSHIPYSLLPVPNPLSPSPIQPPFPAHRPLSLPHSPSLSPIQPPIPIPTPLPCTPPVFELLCCVVPSPPFPP